MNKRVNKKKDIISITQKLRSSIVNYKSILIAIILAILSILLVYFGLSLSNPDRIPDPQSSVRIAKLIPELIVTIGGSIFSVAVLSLVWEVFVRRAWLSEMREHIFDTLSKPEVANTLNDNWQLRTIKQLLCNLSGKEIGEMIHDGFKDKIFSPDLLRRDFTYNVTLCDNNIIPKFYESFFYINYKTSSFSYSFNVRLLINDNSMQIHDDYQALLARHKDDIYRYILFTNKARELKNDKIKLINVKKCEIRKDNIKFSLDISQPQIDSEDGSTFITLSVPDKMIDAYKNVHGKECELTLLIETLVDKEWCYFPMMFGYPVDKFKTRLDFVNAGNHEINIVGLFTSSGKFIRDESIHKDLVSAAGRIDDIILPDSGLVYVWK